MSKGADGGRRWWALVVPPMAPLLLPLLLLLAWDATGWDLPAARWFGSAQGFALRDNVWTSTLLHDGGRRMAWVLLACLAWAAWRAPTRDGASSGASGPVGRLPGPAGRSVPVRAERLRWIAVMLLCALLVPALKRLSPISCPWDLAEFGGVARVVSHWRLRSDGGPGGCFPSGHAVAAFAFFGQYFLWLPHSRRRARGWLMAVLGMGLLFGGAQLARGAHFPSHTLWSGWLCWALCWAASRWMQRRGWTPAPARATDPGGHNAPSRKEPG